MEWTISRFIFAIHILQEIYDNSFIILLFLIAVSFMNLGYARRRIRSTHEEDCKHMLDSQQGVAGESHLSWERPVDNGPDHMNSWPDYWFLARNEGQGKNHIRFQDWLRLATIGSELKTVMKQNTPDFWCLSTSQGSANRKKEKSVWANLNRYFSG